VRMIAEEKLLRRLEQNIIESKRIMKPSDFRKVCVEAHALCQNAIRMHRSMIDLWTQMDRRTRKAAREGKANEGMYTTPASCGAPPDWKNP